MTDLEDRLRDALHRRAQATTISSHSYQQPSTTPPKSRRAQLVVTCWGAAIVTVGGLVALSNRTVEQTINAAIVTSTIETTQVPVAASTTIVVGRDWRTLATPPLSARDDAAVVWTGTQILVWGGGTYNAAPFADGAVYEPATDSWTTMPAAPLNARHDPVSAWTGTEMIVWGGIDGAPLADGAAYNPATNTWRTIASAPLDGVAARMASTVWTGTELIISGGDDAGGQPLVSGAAYNPSTDTWRTLAASPLLPRHEAATVWTGTEMVLWGGAPDEAEPGYAPHSDGAAYNPSTDTWRTIAASPLDGRIAPAVWTGTEMLIVAGRNSDRDGMFAFGDGAAYNPATDRWHKVADGPAHPGFEATWTGEAMILFAKGGLFRYNPATDTWTDPDVNQFPGQGRLLWTGRELILSGTTYDGNVTAAIAAVTP
jgi:N-acetylneuraminic acid mutarotase